MGVQGFPHPGVTGDRKTCLLHWRLLGNCGPQQGRVRVRKTGNDGRNWPPCPPPCPFRVLGTSLLKMWLFPHCGLTELFIKMQMSLNSNLISLRQLMGLTEQNTATCRSVRRPGPNPHLSDSLWAHPWTPRMRNPGIPVSVLFEVWRFKKRNQSLEFYKPEFCLL